MFLVAASIQLIAIAVVAITAVFALALVAIRRQDATLPAPKHGPISCDGCTALVAKDVSYVGQQINCPRCGFQVTAPGVQPGSFRRSARAGLVLAVGIVLALLVLARLGR